MIKSKNQMFIVIAVFALILFLGGATYAWFYYRGETGSSEAVAGDIYLTMTEGNETLTLTNVFPETKEQARARNDNFITFTLNGLNESNKAIYYEILLNHGDDKPSPKTRYNDADLMFDLVELDSNGNEVEYVVDAKSYDALVNKRIWVDTIDANTDTNVSKKYKLRAWLSDEVIISDTEANANYNTTEFPNKYATIKVSVNGDMTYKEMPSAYTKIRDLAATASYIASYDDIIQANPAFTTQDQVSTSATKQTVYYYTGNDAAANANVLFAGYCWQIIRTTDNGGVRMIYNGVAVNNKCETTRTATKGINGTNGGSSTSLSGATLFGRSYDYDLATGEFTIEDSTGLPTAWSESDSNNNGKKDYEELIGTYTCKSNSATCTTLYYVGSYKSSTQAYVASYTIGDVAHFSQMGKSAFNANYRSPALVGYMFNKEYDYKQGSKSGEYYTNAVWENGAYTLSSGNSGTAPDATHHYICDTDCTKVRYYYYSSNYYILLENGNTVEDALKEMVNYKTNANDADENINVYNSAIKGYLDNWYKKNLTAYASYLDNETVYCNDRSVRDLGGWNPSGTNLNGTLNFYQYSVNKDLSCVNETDRFSKSNSKAKLDYPIGVLSEPERNLMTANFAKTGQYYWALSPGSFDLIYAIVSYVAASGDTFSDYVYLSYGARGVVALKPGIEFDSGTGTYIDPYVVGPLVQREN